MERPGDPGRSSAIQSMLGMQNPHHCGRCSAVGDAGIQHVIYCITSQNSFSWDNLSWQATLSISTPKKMMRVLGLSILWRETGMPIIAQTCSALLRLLEHWKALWLPMNTKSSSMSK